MLKCNVRKDYTSIKQGSHESIILYQECFDEVLKLYEGQENTKVEGINIVIDFFDGLDNTRCALVKATIINGITAGSSHILQSLMRCTYLPISGWKPQELVS